MGSQLRVGRCHDGGPHRSPSTREFSELRGNGQLDEAATVLSDIEDYNQYDCRSTRELRKFGCCYELTKSGVIPLGAQPVPDGGAIEEADALAVKLEEFCGVAGEPRPHPRANGCCTGVPAARGFHRREDKPFWWAHFHRLNYPVDEWSDDAERFSSSTKPRSPSIGASRRVPQKMQRRLQLTGELARGGLNSKVFALYEPPAPSGFDRQP